MSEKRCKHNNGWLSADSQSIFVFPDSKVKIGFKGRNKFLMRCNNPDCSAVRNGYLIKAEVKFGKIRQMRSKLKG